MCTWVTISKQLTYPFLNFNGCTTDTADIRFNKVTQIPFQMHFLNENYHRSIRSLFYWSNLQLIITSSCDDLASDSRQSIILTDSFIYAFPGLKESRSFMVLNVTSKKHQQESMHVHSVVQILNAALVSWRALIFFKSNLMLFCYSHNLMYLAAHNSGRLLPFACCRGWDQVHDDNPKLSKPRRWTIKQPGVMYTPLEQ